MPDTSNYHVAWCKRLKKVRGRKGGMQFLETVWKARLCFERFLESYLRCFSILKLMKSKLLYNKCKMSTWAVEYPAMVRLFQYFIEDIGVDYLARWNANSVVFRINRGIIWKQWHFSSCLISIVHSRSIRNSIDAQLYTI